MPFLPYILSRIVDKHIFTFSYFQDAVTHDEILSVKTVNFEWQPPLNASGNISFYATVVKDKRTFWVKLKSPELYKRVSVT